VPGSGPNLSDILAVAGLIVSVGGWATALVQIRRVRKASEAVTGALVDERRRTAAATLVGASADLADAERLLHHAMSIGRHETVTAVRGCRDQAVQVQRLISALAPPGQDDLVRTLSEFLTLADVCVGELLEDETEVAVACQRVVWRLSRATRLSLGLRMAIINPGSS
jgi:hypothetical protein